MLLDVLTRILCTLVGAINVPQKIVLEYELNLRFKNPLECHLIFRIIRITERTVEWLYTLLVLHSAIKNPEHVNYT